jgi:hypothetical protein
MYMRMIEVMTHKEVSELTGVSPSHVGKLNQGMYRVQARANLD